MAVITFLALLFIVGIVFFALAQNERVASARNLDSLRVRYITEAAVAYGRELLKLDKETNLIDSLIDMTLKDTSGSDIDLDGDGKPESRWFNMNDSQGMPFGRFSLKISDEASKLNLNYAAKESLEYLFSRIGIDASKANALVSRRPFNAIEETASIFGKKEFQTAKDFITVYSRDREITLDRQRRAYLNSNYPQIILDAFLNTGINNPLQKAASLKDASDMDLAQTIFEEYIRGYVLPTRLLEEGDWKKINNFYEAPAGGAAGKFGWDNLSVEDGEYLCFFYGPSAEDTIGEVYVDGQESSAELLYSQDALIKKIKVTNSSISLNIKPAKDKISRFSYIELVSLEPKKGLTKKIISGQEALVINELMPKPSKQILLDEPVQLSPGENFTHTFTQVKQGNYYVMVLANIEGGRVGDVEINGVGAAGLYDQDYFPYTVNVSSGIVAVNVKNNTLSKVSFKGIKALQQPDAEFIEILNLSPGEIDLSDFSFEVYSPQNELIPGWPAKIPEGTKIKSYQHMVIAIDNNDSAPCPSKLRSNNISFQRNWGINGVGLDFSEHLEDIDKYFDLLPDKGGTVIFKDSAGRQIDAVEYTAYDVQDFISLERPDPTVKIDDDNDGLFDGWYPSQDKNQATAGSTNDNAGMYTRDENNNLVKHAPGETIVFNRPLSDFNEVWQLSSSKAWGRFSMSDVARMADKFSSQAQGLELTKHYVEGRFIEKDGFFESSHKGDSGIWRFDNIPAGIYLLSIISDNLSTEGLKIKVAYRTDSGEDFNNYSGILFLEGIALFGSIQLDKDNLAFELNIINDSEEKLVIKKFSLEPINFAPGRINANTASNPILGSIGLSDDLIQLILANRPIGAKDDRKLGIGELFLLNENFLAKSNDLTVKSDVYEITCHGEYFPQGKTLAYQTLRIVVERGD